MENTTPTPKKKKGGIDRKKGGCPERSARKRWGITKGRIWPCGTKEKQGLRKPWREKYFRKGGKDRKTTSSPASKQNGV